MERIISSQVPTGKREHDVDLLAAVKWQIPVQKPGCQAGLGKTSNCEQSVATEPGSPRGPRCTGVFCWQEKQPCATGAAPVPAAGAAPSLSPVLEQKHPFCLCNQCCSI